ncbi:hypothetical protein FACS1894126_0340 [Alphaproteobacteria bacterium]|nr:hypothetical protein FACS1894126_0340 [Alphaproteobacteria bacterium]
MPMVGVQQFLSVRVYNKETKMKVLGKMCAVTVVILASQAYGVVCIMDLVGNAGAVAHCCSRGGNTTASWVLVSEALEFSLSNMELFLKRNETFICKDLKGLVAEKHADVLAYKEDVSMALNTIKAMNSTSSDKKLICGLEKEKETLDFHERLRKENASFLKFISDLLGRTREVLAILYPYVTSKENIGGLDNLLFMMSPATDDADRSGVIPY